MTSDFGLNKLMNTKSIEILFVINPSTLSHWWNAMKEERIQEISVENWLFNSHLVISSHLHNHHPCEKSIRDIYMNRGSATLSRTKTLSKNRSFSKIEAKGGCSKVILDWLNQDI